MINVKFIGHWNSDEYIYNQFKMFTKDGLNWNSIHLAGPNEPFDFLIIVNYPRESVPISPHNTIYFAWEPIDARKHWGKFFHPNPNEFFAVYDISYTHNIPCWQISKNWKWLTENKISKNKLISGVVSDKTFSPYGEMRVGREKRISFIVNYLSRLPNYDHFGKLHYENSPFLSVKNYRGELKNKEDGLFPYLYTFAAENGVEENYFTEKLIDGILSECYVFYSGHSSAAKHFNSKCFTLLDLDYPEVAFQQICEEMRNCIRKDRLNEIYKEKHRILNMFSIFPLLESLFYERGVLPQ